METFSALLALCAGNSPITGEFPTQRPVTRSFDVFFDLRLWVNNREAGDLGRHRSHYNVIVITGFEMYDDYILLCYGQNGHMINSLRSEIYQFQVKHSTIYPVKKIHLCFNVGSYICEVPF